MKQVCFGLIAYLMAQFSFLYGECRYLPNYTGYDNCVYSYPCRVCETYAYPPVDFCNVSCCSPCCVSLDVNAGVLYWRAFEGGLTAGCGPVTISETTTGAVTNSVLVGRNDGLHFPWDVGYRVGVAVNNIFRTPGLCFEGEYTHFQTTVKRKGSDDVTWKLCFNEIDECIGYQINACNCFTLIPFIGVREAVIHQKLTRSFTSTSTTDGVTSFDERSSYAKERFVGVGPLLGFFAEARLACHFGLFCSLEIADLFGYSHVKSRRTRELSTETELDQLKRCFQLTQFVFDYSVGINWELCLCNFTFIPQLAWEQHRYFDHGGVGCCGDLGLGGLTASATLDFCF